jgi:hypothetical protein
MPSWALSRGQATMAHFCSIFLHNCVPCDSVVLMLSLPCTAHH